MATAALLLCLVCPYVMSYEVNPLDSPSRTSRSVAEGRPPHLYHNDMQFTSDILIGKRNIQENDIAAIFKGVAYGKPSNSAEQRTTVSSSSSTVATRAAHNADSTTEAPAARRSVLLATRYDVTAQEGALNYFVEVTHQSDSVTPSWQQHPDDHHHRDSHIASSSPLGYSITVHVYVTESLMMLVAASSMCCFCRIHLCSQIIPRGHYVTLHLLLILAAALRCIVLLHDPYGFDGKLPRALVSLLLNTVQPVLSTAYALVLLVLLRAAKYQLLPSFMQSPMCLALIAGVHISLSAMVDVWNGILEYPPPSRPLEAGVQCATVLWEAALGLGYVTVLHQANKESSSRPINLPKYTWGCVALATFLKVALIIFLLHRIFTQGFMSDLTMSMRTWSWWVTITCERLVEVVFCLSLIGILAVLTMKQSNVSNTEQKIFSLLPEYEQTTKFASLGRTNSKRFIASNFAFATSARSKTSGNSPNFVVTPQNIYDSTTHFKIPMNNGSRLGKFSSSTEIISEEASNLDTNQTGAEGRLLPRYYCAPVPVLLEHDAAVIGRVTPCAALKPQHIYQEIGDSCCKTSSPAPRGVYSPTVHTSQRGRNYHAEHLYDLPHRSSSSERIDSYSAQMQAGGEGTQRNLLFSSSEFDCSYNLMLPLQTTMNIPGKPPNHTRYNNNQLDTSPDSAIVLDYSSHSEFEDHSAHYTQRLENIQEQQVDVKKSGCPALSAQSLNTVLNYDDNLFNKFVNISPSTAGYQPLRLEDCHVSVNIEEDAQRKGRGHDVAEEGRDAEEVCGPASEPLVLCSTTSVTPL